MLNIEDRPNYKSFLKFLERAKQEDPKKLKRFLVTQGQRYIGQYGMFFFWNLVQKFKLEKE